MGRETKSKKKLIETQNERKNWIIQMAAIK